MYLSQARDKFGFWAFLSLDSFGCPLFSLGLHTKVGNQKVTMPQAFLWSGPNHTMHWRPPQKGWKARIAHGKFALLTQAIERSMICLLKK
jgi:hypothetical protein